MTDQPAPEATPDEAAPPAALQTAGAMLAAARLAAGQSIEAIATQLKLAPRQVRALEDGDYSALPGRTFVRGFVRNYARLVHLDPQAVLAALPGEGADPGLARPTIAAQGRAMGEIPVEAKARTWTRWAIPLALVLVILVGVAYERLRPQGSLGRDAAPATAPAVPATPAVPAPTADAPAGGTPLPNPVTAPADAPAPDTAPSSPAPATPATSSAMPSPSTAAAPATASPSAAVVPAAVTAAAAPAATAARPAPDAGNAAGAPLEIAFRGVSWIEVKDAKGASVLNMTGSPGATQALRAAPPLDIVVGNAPSVDVTFRGARVDLAPYTKQNIARLTLR